MPGLIVMSFWVGSDSSCTAGTADLTYFTQCPSSPTNIFISGVIAEDGFIIEPYKIFKSYVEKNKAHLGRSPSSSMSPLSSAPSTPRVVDKPAPAGMRHTV